MNIYYNPSGNPATGSEGLSSLIRGEFAAIGAAFDMIPQISTTGLYSTVLNQVGNYTFTLPNAPGTLATTANIATETSRATAAEVVLTAAVTTEATARATADGLLAPLASPALTGVPTAPTAAPGTNTTQLATTAFATAAASALVSGVASVAGKTGTVTLVTADVSGAAPLASPALTGTPTAPTAAPGTSSTQLATTAFNAAAIATAITTETTRATAAEGANATAITTETTRATAAEGANATAATTNAGRNLLNNARFEINQRGVGAFSAVAVKTYTADQWYHSSAHSNGAFSDQVFAVADAGRLAIGDEDVKLAYSSNVTGGTGAGDYDVLAQSIENVRRLAGKTVTVSFWANSAAAPKLALEFCQIFGTGGSPSATVTAAATASWTLSASWTRYSATVTLPNIQGKTVGTNGDDYTQMLLWISAGSTYSAPRAASIGVQSAVVNFWGLQVEINPAPTALERRPTGQELAACQRFFVSMHGVINGYGVTGAGTGQTVGLPVAMRGNPTLTIGTTGNSNISGAALNGALLGNCGIWMNGTVTATGIWIMNMQFTASAEL